MTVKNFIDEELDTATIQKNIQYLTNLSKSMAKKEDQNTLNTIAMGMKNQLADEAKKKQQQAQQPKQPQADPKTTAQPQNNTATAQPDTTLQTAQ